MKLLTPRQMKTIDEIAINTLGIPGIVLMENAAIQTAFKASSMLEGKEEPNITVIAGNGNNGGDALAVTRHLLTMGYAVSVFYDRCGRAFRGCIYKRQNFKKYRGYYPCNIRKRGS